jgi:hypothetical protein
MYTSKGYKIDNMMRVRPDTARTVNFGDLWDCLRSKDKSLCDGMFSEDANEDVYINMKAKRTVSSMGQKVAFSTYPRCGSSFFRKFFQLITGTATGSDMLLEFVVDM